jgi:hypothetical protein
MAALAATLATACQVEGPGEGDAASLAPATAPRLELVADTDGEPSVPAAPSPAAPPTGATPFAAPTTVHTATVAVEPLPAACTPEAVAADPAGCCTPGQALRQGTAAADFVSVSSSSAVAQCVVALGGDDDAYTSAVVDTVVLGEGHDYVSARAGDDLLLGGPGDDTLKGGTGRDRLEGGPGHDTLYGNEDDDVLVGGPGDDHLQGHAGADLIVPGPGEDFVLAGDGDDVVLVLDVCELTAGEYLAGGTGTDTLVTPVPLAELTALGVTVTGFEVIEVDPTRSAESACGGCGCALQPGQTTPTCCSDAGTCVEDPTAERSACECDPEVFGDTCDYDPAETFFPGPDTDKCPTGDPVCDGLSSAQDEVIDPASIFDTCTVAPGQPAAEYAALLYYPTDITGAPLGPAGTPRPIIAFNAGNGFDVSRYAGLAQLWARNGFVVLVHGPDNLEKSARYQRRVDAHRCAREYLSKNPRPDLFTADPNHFVYAGHSRGGEVSIIAAKFDATDSIVQWPRPSAVIALAPLDACLREQVATCDVERGPAGFAELSFIARLRDDAAESFLVLEGSRDGDTNGDGIRLYDAATPEVAEGRPSNAPWEAALWAIDAQHSEWTGALPTPAPATPLSLLDGALLARAFSLQWLKLHVLEQPRAYAWFTGDDVSACIVDPEQCGLAVPPPQFSIQRRSAGSDAGVFVKPLQYFVGSPSAPFATGRVVAAPSGRILRDVDGSGADSVELPIDRLAGNFLQVPAPDAPGGLLQPSDSAFVTLDVRDAEAGDAPIDLLATPASTLEFRVAVGYPLLPNYQPGDLECPQEDDRERLACQCENHYASRRGEVQLKVSFFDVDGEQSAVASDRLSGNGVVGGPDSGWHVERFEEGFPVPSCQSIEYWTTVSIPLDEFVTADADFDPTRVRSLRVEAKLQADGAPDAEAFLAFDSFELVHVPLLCNDGVLDSSDSCESETSIELTCEDLGLSGDVLGCTPQCRFDASSCAACKPGDNGCKCLQLDGHAPAGISLQRSVFGDGRYCHDDVVLGGVTRCVELIGGEGDRCLTLANGQGPWSPCFPTDGCFSKFEVEGVEEVVMDFLDMSCIGVRGPSDSAPSGGYCFALGEEPEDGGQPGWFIDAYCDAVYPGTMGMMDLTEGLLCIDP